MFDFWEVFICDLFIKYIIKTGNHSSVGVAKGEEMDCWNSIYGRERDFFFLTATRGHAVA
jgi:hypothetical protein